jgi:hypothetical protein
MGNYYNDNDANRVIDSGQGATSDGPYGLRWDAAINFDWGTASPVPRAINADNLIAVWKGYVRCPPPAPTPSAPSATTGSGSR